MDAVVRTNDAKLRDSMGLLTGFFNWRVGRVWDNDAARSPVRKTGQCPDRAKKYRSARPDR
jgi:hypothetical protein